MSDPINSFKEWEDSEEENLKQRLVVVLDFLRNGMSIKDSLIMAEVDLDTFERYQVANPLYAKKVARKMTEYKYDVVQAINKGIAGKEADPKMAQWLAEAKYTDEYSRRKTDGPQDSNQITNVINLIQAGDSGMQVLPSIKNAKVAKKTVKQLKINQEN